MIILIRKTSDIMSDILKEIESKMQQVKELGKIMHLSS